MWENPPPKCYTFCTISRGKEGKYDGGEKMNKSKMVLQNTSIRKDNHQFDDIVKIVESAKARAYRKVNEELILMYQ